jgi:hypothetical protein
VGKQVDTVTGKQGIRQQGTGKEDERGKIQKTKYKKG